MSPNTSQIQLRAASTAHNDGPFILSAFDSTLPYLSSIGSGEQWGNNPLPFSERPGFVKETLESVALSESFALTGEGEKIFVLIAEIVVELEDVETMGGECSLRQDDQGKRWLSVGTATVREDWVPAYVSKHTHLGLKLSEGEGNTNPVQESLYLEVMVTDYRTGIFRKGTGTALIQGAIKYAREKGKKVVYVDAWGGNERKLVHYYEHQGFSTVGDFSMPRSNGSMWLGTLLRMDV